MEKATETLKQADSSDGDLAFCVKRLVNCCPKCGGSSGYEFKRVIRHTYSGTWAVPESSMDEQEYVVEDERVSQDLTVLCLDCGKRIKRSDFNFSYAKHNQRWPMSPAKITARPRRLR